jgi:hypothetical protein
LPPDHHRLDSYELALEHGFTILQKKLDDLFEVAIQLVQGFGLRVGPWEARDVAHIEAGVRTSFDNGGVGGHRRLQRARFQRSGRALGVRR